MEKITNDVINKIFINRSGYDKSRYVTRENNERDLRQCIERYNVIFIQGESGCGKTWITTHVLEECEKAVEEINMGEVFLQGGLLKYFQTKFPEVESGRTISGTAGVSIPIASASGGMTTSYNTQCNYFLEYLKKNKDKVLKIDNLEVIVNNKSMIEEVISFITLSDDKFFQSLHIKLIVIGAMDNIMSFFQSACSYNTIATRPFSITLGGFNENECTTIVNKGFKQCGFSYAMSSNIPREIYKKTGGLPYNVNELCYSIALKFLEHNIDSVSDNNSGIVKEGIYDWIYIHLRMEYDLLKKLYNENLKKNEVLNYILYKLQEFEVNEFSSSELYTKIDGVLPSSKKLSKNTVKKYLDQLSDDGNNSNIIMKTQPDGYKVKSYKTYACVSELLYEKEEGIYFVTE